MSTEKDIITFYNERGASEKNFDIQNNDFGWSHLPFSFMAENMVFMMVTAMLKNFYLYLVRHISDKVKPLKKTSRLKAFILHFVSVPAKWVRTGRQNVLNLYTNKGLPEFGVISLISDSQYLFLDFYSFTSLYLLNSKECKVLK